MMLKTVLNKKRATILSLHKKVIWITGASSGIGEALALHLAELGAQLVLSGRNKSKLESVQQKCHNSHQHIVLDFDLLDAVATEKAYQKLVGQVQSIDWLINNAGLSQRSLIMDTDEKVERKLMEIDYFAQTRLTRLVLPKMIQQKKGKVVMVSSVAGILGTQYRGGYSAAKSAIYIWANSLRAELSNEGIQVATVFPGFVNTNVSINAITGDGTAQGTMDEQTSAGLAPKYFAKKVVTALLKNEEYIVIGGKKEILATWIHRVSPATLYKVIRKNSVT